MSFKIRSLYEEYNRKKPANHLVGSIAFEESRKDDMKKTIDNLTESDFKTFAHHMEGKTSLGSYFAGVRTIEDLKHIMKLSLGKIDIKNQGADVLVISKRTVPSIENRVDFTEFGYNKINNYVIRFNLPGHGDKEYFDVRKYIQDGKGEFDKIIREALIVKDIPMRIIFNNNLKRIITAYPDFRVSGDLNLPLGNSYLFK